MNGLFERGGRSAFQGVAGSGSVDLVAAVEGELVDDERRDG